MVVIKIKQNSIEKVRNPGEEKVRRHFDENSSKWYYSIVDVIAILTKTTDARNYWKVLKNRLKKTQNELVTKCNQLKMMSRDGKFYLTDTADAETMILIIESIPKASVEAFKLLIQRIEEDRSQDLIPYSNRDQIGQTHKYEGEEAKLLVDAYETSTNIFIEAMVAGVLPDDLSITVLDKKVFIKGKRIKPENTKNISSENYLCQELYWTDFSRTILLPSKVKMDNIETSGEYGKLTIKLTKVSKI